MEFKVGDVVRLLSGGCKMVVYDTSGKRIWVVYHDLVGKPQKECYNTSVIYKVSPEMFYD